MMAQRHRLGKRPAKAARQGGAPRRCAKAEPGRVPIDAAARPAYIGPQADPGSARGDCMTYRPLASPATTPGTTTPGTTTTTTGTTATTATTATTSNGAAMAARRAP
jgi:hypothetical protein